MIIPALDLSGVHVVRLKQGDFAQKTVFNVEPIKRIFDAANQGAELIHIVDLDGAKDPIYRQRAMIYKIVKASPVPIQTRRLRLLQDMLPAVLHDGRDGDHVHLIGEEGADGADLLCLLLLGIFKHQPHARAFRGGLHIHATADAPLALRAQLGKAKQNPARLGLGRGLRAARAQREKRRQKAQWPQAPHGHTSS